MHRMNLSSVDLNLLVVLDALLETRSPTLAAKRVSLSQPATSHALARLRELFEDPLLVRSGRTLVPTPFATELRPLVRDAMTALDRALAGPIPFDPRTSRRVFTLAAGDYVTAVLVPDLVEHLAEHAPGVELFVKPATDDNLAELREGSLDVVTQPVRTEALPPELDHEPLIADRFVCVVREGHRFARRRMRLDDYCAQGHVLIAPSGRTRRGYVDEVLEAQGRDRRIVVTVPHFLVAPLVVARTDLVLTIAERIATLVAPTHGLVIAEPPLAVPGFTIETAWHTRNTEDAAHRFLRESLAFVARRTPTKPLKARRRS